MWVTMETPAKTIYVERQLPWEKTYMVAMATDTSITSRLITSLQMILLQFAKIWPTLNNWKWMLGQTKSEGKLDSSAWCCQGIVMFQHTRKRQFQSFPYKITKSCMSSRGVGKAITNMQWLTRWAPCVKFAQQPSPLFHRKLGGIIKTYVLW